MQETFSWIEKLKLDNIIVLEMNAGNIGFSTGTFDISLCGFIGWDYCFDFALGDFFAPDVRLMEIWRVLRKGGRIAISSWEWQDDLEWMEEMLIRHFPSILNNYQQGGGCCPMNYSRENSGGYRRILECAGFTNIDISREKAEFVSDNEEQWWQQMNDIGWHRYFEEVERMGAKKLSIFKEAVFEGLQAYKHKDGIHFTKSVIYAIGEK